jgi:hypothetical protein
VARCSLSCTWRQFWWLICCLWTLSINRKSLVICIGMLSFYYIEGIPRRTCHISFDLERLLVIFKCVSRSLYHVCASATIMSTVTLTVGTWLVSIHLVLMSRVWRSFGWRLILIKVGVFKTVLSLLSNKIFWNMGVYRSLLFGLWVVTKAKARFSRGVW